MYLLQMFHDSDDDKEESEDIPPPVASASHTQKAQLNCSSSNMYADLDALLAAGRHGWM